MLNLNPLNQVGVFLFLVVAVLVAYIYCHYIKRGEPLPPSDKDWKRTRDTVVAEAIKDLEEFIQNFKRDLAFKRERLDNNLSIMFKQLWNDGIFQWGFIAECFKEFGRLINWKKYRVVYCIIILILCGLFLYYVIGV
ncbi:MAG: hypothetical protein KBS60_01250 [Phascolarctobacterium sp.]|nr:hypothetical protein [Candidatus Phascolarctobacterium caballi]